VRHVAGGRGEGEATPSPLFAAVRAGDVGEVRRLLADGANPRLDDGRETPLHAAARSGPLALVEAFIEGGAFEWQTDRKGRLPLDVARRGRSRERTAIVALLDRGRPADPSFRAAVEAIQAGDTAALARLIDTEPRLLRERIVEPDVYHRVPRPSYFLDPKLFWYVANNPSLAKTMPSNMADVAQVMIDRGVDRADLDYALELTMSSDSARMNAQQRPLMRVLMAAGAKPTRGAVLITAAYKVLDPLRALLDAGELLSVPIAAALGMDEELRALLPAASADDVQTAFGLAVINRHLQAAQLALDAGADVDAVMPVHAHMTALHQAAGDDDAAMIELLLSRGARTDRRDTLWDATPLGWAVYFDRKNARAVLEALGA
jgi:Ankyrin repeats (3 copies)